MTTKKDRHRRIFFYSDPHFGHKNVLGYSKRPFNDVDHMTEEFAKRYNSVVGADDTVVWVGDCFFFAKAKARAVMDSLNGQKILVLGNHDKSATQMTNLGFAWVCSAMTMQIAGEQVTVKHYPFRPSRWDFAVNGGPSKELLRLGGLKNLFGRIFKPQNHIRYWFRRPKDHGGYHIHGHTHNDKKFRGRQIHVGVDAWDYTPVDVEKIVKYIHKHKAGTA